MLQRIQEDTRGVSTRPVLSAKIFFKLVDLVGQHWHFLWLAPMKARALQSCEQIEILEGFFVSLLYPLCPRPTGYADFIAALPSQTWRCHWSDPSTSYRGTHGLYVQ